MPACWALQITSPRLFAACWAWCFVLTSAVPVVFCADDDLPNAQPVPRMQVLPLPLEQASVTRDGTEISRYFFGNSNKRPFLYPLVGPSGRSLTRMGHPRDPNGHSHHNSVWISHHDVNGVSFWGDTGGAKIVHKRVAQYEDSADEALIQVHNAWNDDTGKTLLDELRTLRFRPQNDGEWLLILDLELTAKSTVTFGKTPFGLLGVRMAKTIGVHDGGGRILNSNGERDEMEVFWKRAKWCDYSGPIAPNKREGIAIFDHPQNPNHPTVFHVRSDGWMGSSFTHDAARTIEPNQPLKLRYALWIHQGVPQREALEKEFQAFVDKVAEPPVLKKK